MSSIYKPNRIGILGLSAFVMAMLLGAKPAIERMTYATSEQIQQAQLLQNFRGSVDAISEVRQTFDKKFSNASAIVDLISVRESLKFSEFDLKINVDTLAIQSVDPVTLPSGDPRLIRICVAQPGGGVDVFAKSFEQAFASLRRISERVDLSIGSYIITLDEKSGEPKVKFMDLCLLAKNA